MVGGSALSARKCRVPAVALLNRAAHRPTPDRKADATVGVFCDEKAALKAERLAIRLNWSRNSD
jgi:hypothetical protein